MNHPKAENDETSCQVMSSWCLWGKIRKYSAWVGSVWWETLCMNNPLTTCQSQGFFDLNKIAEGPSPLLWIFHTIPRILQNPKINTKKEKQALRHTYSMNTHGLSWEWKHGRIMANQLQERTAPKGCVNCYRPSSTFFWLAAQHLVVSTSPSFEHNTSLSPKGCWAARHAGTAA